MKSARSHFNWGVFVKSVLRFWPIWSIYAFVWMLALPLNLISTLSDNGTGSTNLYVLDTIYMAEFLCPLAACASALAVFSHMYYERSADFFAALPVRREAMYISLTAAGLLPLLVVNVAILALTFAVETVFGFAGLGLLLQWFCVVTLMIVAYFGIAVFCAQLTGHIVVMPVLFAAFGVVVSWLGSMALIVPEMFCYGYTTNGPIISDMFSPFVCFSKYTVYSYSYETGTYLIDGWRFLIIYGLFGVLLLPASGVLYKRRNVESAHDVVAIASLRPVFQLVCSFAAAFILGNMLYTLPFGADPADGIGPAVLYIFCMAAAAFIGWFVSAMLVNKSFAVFSGAKHYIGWVVVCAVCAVLVLSCELDLTGYEQRIPDESDIKSVTVDCGGARAEFNEPENIALALDIHQSAIDSRQENESATGETTGLRIDYTLSDGDKLSRKYSIASGGTDTLYLLEKLMNSTEGITERKDPGVPMTASTIMGGRITFTDYDNSVTETALELDSAQALELYVQCILPDMRDGTIGLVWFSADEEYYETVYNCRISLDVSTPNQNVTEFYTVPTVYSEHTNAWLEAHGIVLETISEAE